MKFSITLGSRWAALIVALFSISAFAQSGSQPSGPADDDGFSFDELFGDTQSEPATSRKKSGASSKPVEPAPERAESGAANKPAEPASARAEPRPKDKPTEPAPARAESDSSSPDAEPTSAEVIEVGAAEPAVAPAAATPPRTRYIEEVVVTANRRTQSIQDVAASIEVLDGGDLERSGAAGMADFVFSVPGTDLLDTGLEKRLSIRGIANIATTAGVGFGSSNSPIGLYLSDTPIQGNGSTLPDLDLYDLQRVEVLKGPQGTLYGEGSQGGAIKMLLNPADPAEFFTKGEIGFGHTYNGSGLNNFQKLAVNVPVSDDWAVRIVGSNREDQGYVDFPERGSKGENDISNVMGRLHVDGALSDTVSLSTMMMYQKQGVDQYPNVYLEEGDLISTDKLDQYNKTEVSLLGINLDWDLPFATLTSSTSGFVNDRISRGAFPLLAGQTSNDASVVPGGEDMTPPPAEEEWVETQLDQIAFAQEIRLVSAGDSWINWIAGFYFRWREAAFDSLVDNSETTNVPPPEGPGIMQNLGAEEYEQYALFGEVTMSLKHNLELNLGVRGFMEDVSVAGQLFYRTAFYPLALSQGRTDGSAADPIKITVGTTAVSPKISLSWFPSDLTMLYALAANGVRSGGTNTAVFATEIQPVFDPDYLWTYELGAKTEFFGGRLTANFAAFYNAWKDLQLNSFEEAQMRGAPPGVTVDQGHITNAGKAYTQGVELSVIARPLSDISLSINLFSADGLIKDGDERQTIPDGTRMPQLAKFSWSANLSYAPTRWSIGTLAPLVSLSAAGTGRRTAFPPIGGYAGEMDGFETYDLMFGLQNDRWDFTLNLSNLTDERTQLGVPQVANDATTIGRPRTWLARIGFQF